jgi:replication factor C subunit 1
LLLQAQEYGTKMLDEDALFDLIRRLPGKKSKYEVAAEKELSQVVSYTSLKKTVVLFVG